MVSFGNNVHVASGVTFINHDVAVLMLRHMEQDAEFNARTGEIVVGNNVFIGANTVLLYGIHIGNNVVIGVGSIVKKYIGRNGNSRNFHASRLEVLKTGNKE